jgi:hypothetical protein
MQILGCTDGITIGFFVVSIAMLYHLQIRKQKPL